MRRSSSEHFSNPIAGVITATRLPREPEPIFGNPDVEYPTTREVEPQPERDERLGVGSLILESDHQTLFVELQENPGRLNPAPRVDRNRVENAQ